MCRHFICLENCMFSVFVVWFTNHEISDYSVCSWKSLDSFYTRCVMMLVLWFTCHDVAHGGSNSWCGSYVFTSFCCIFLKHTMHHAFCCLLTLLCASHVWNHKASWFCWSKTFSVLYKLWPLFYGFVSSFYWVLLCITAAACFLCR